MGPAYAAWILTGVADGLIGTGSDSDDETRSEGLGCECFFALRGAEGMWPSSLGKVTLSARAGSACALLGDAAGPLRWP